MTNTSGVFTTKDIIRLGMEQDTCILLDIKTHNGLRSVFLPGISVDDVSANIIMRNVSLGIEIVSAQAASVQDLVFNLPGMKEQVHASSLVDVVALAHQVGDETGQSANKMRIEKDGKQYGLWSHLDIMLDMAGIRMSDPMEQPEEEYAMRA